jgi:hypothetical protein
MPLSTLSSSNYINEFSNLSVEDVKLTSKNQLTPLLSEYELDATTHSSVNLVHFCPFDNSNLLIYQSAEEIGKLSIFLIDFTNNQFKSEFIEDVVVGSQVNLVAWSPKTKCIVFFCSKFLSVY